MAAQKDSSKAQYGADKVSRYNWSDPGSPGRFMMIHKDQIVIDEDLYQRCANSPAAEKKVLKIASDFNWVAFQVVSVVERDGAYHAVDAGHRVRAARRRSDVSYLPCMVFDIGSIQDEAEHFLKVNTNRKPMNAVDRHKAYLVAEEPTATLAEKYVESAGREFSSSSGPGFVSCVNDIRYCIQTDKDALDRVWPVVVDLCEERRINRQVLMGLYYLERFANEKPSSRRIRNKILSLGYDEIMDAAKSGAAFHGHGSPTSYADGMLKAINKKLQKKVSIEK